MTGRPLGSDSPAATAAHPNALEKALLILLLMLAWASLISNGWLVSLDRGLWFDEALTVFFVQQNWAGLLSLILAYEANMALYYGGLKLVADLDASEVVLRGVSFAAFLLSIAMIAFSTRRFFGSRAAIAFMVLCLSHFYLIRYSVEVRGYALAGLALAVVWVAWLQGVFAGQKQAWWWYTLAAMVGLHFHFFVALGVFVLGSITLLCYRQQLAFRWWVLIHSLIILSFFPIVLFTLTREQGQLDWLTSPGIRSLVDTAFMYAGSAPEAMNTVRRLLLVATVSLLLLGLWRLWLRRGEAGGSERLAMTLSAVALAAVPVALVFTVSQIIPIFSNRFFVPFVPFFWLTIAVSLSQNFTPRHLLMALVSLTLLLTVSASSYGDREMVSWRKAVEFPLSQCSGSEGFLFMTPNAQAGFQYYQARRDAASHCDWNLYPYLMTAENYLKTPGDYPETLEAVALLQRVWVYRIHKKTTESPVLAQYMEQLAQHFSCRTFIDGGDFQVLECLNRYTTDEERLPVVEQGQRGSGQH